VAAGWFNVLIKGIGKNAGATSRGAPWG